MTQAVQIFDTSTKGVHRFAKVDAGNNLKVSFGDANGANSLLNQVNLDAVPNSLFTIPAQTFPMVYNGASFDLLRTPTTFKHGLITASGNTTIWTPAGGKKFRLMRFAVGISGGATLAAGAIQTILFTDQGSGINGIRFDVQVPNTVVTGEEYFSGWIDWGNGFLSAATNNSLQINLGTAFNAGGATVMVAGTEE